MLYVMYCDLQLNFGELQFLNRSNISIALNYSNRIPCFEAVDLYWFFFNNEISFVSVSLKLEEPGLKSCD